MRYDHLVPSISKNKTVDTVIAIAIIVIVAIAFYVELKANQTGQTFGETLRGLVNR